MTPMDESVLRRLQDAADEPDLAGTRYRLIERVARGGMGTVYRVHEAGLDRDVALKVLSDPDPSGDLARRMQREARVLARLEHPHIIPIHDVGALPDGRTFYVMKLVQGKRLDAWARSGVSGLDVVRLFRQIADAVAFAHARGVIHRDLKPANIMVGAFGEALVMDWGVARVSTVDGGTGKGAVGVTGGPGPTPAIAAEDTHHGTVIGTPEFMAPEQARGDLDAVDARADVFALGATLRAVFPEPLPRRLAAIIARACRPDRDDRYRSALDFSADLRAFADGLPVQAYRARVVERVVRWSARQRVLLSLIAAYLLMRLIVLAVARR